MSANNLDVPRPEMMLSQEPVVGEWMSKLMLLLDYLTEHAGWLIALSVLTAVLTLAIVPVLITQIPADYFNRDKRLHANKLHPLLSIVITTAKNLLGAIFLLIGFVLLFLPGQGLVMIFVGLLIMNYPGKYSLERWLIQRRGVLRALNTLRIKYNKPPFE